MRGLPAAERSGLSENRYSLYKTETKIIVSRRGNITITFIYSVCVSISMDEMVVIKVRRATRAALLARGRKGQSYDDIIQALLQIEVPMPDVISIDGLPVPPGFKEVCKE